MSQSTFKIVHDNNKLTLLNTDEEFLFASLWFMEFGKTVSEVFNSQEKKLFTLVKKFQFWKWRMVFKIEDSSERKFILISQNARNTIYKLNHKNNTYEVKIHYKKRTSFFKNDTKIAELDTSFSSEEFSESIKLVTTKSEEVEIIFMLFSCLKIGDSDQQKPVLKSQKQLESIRDPWT
jgi:hypothetical protein